MRTLATMQQGAYVKYPSGAQTDGFKEDLTQAAKNAGNRLKPKLDLEQPKRWWGNLMCNAGDWTSTVINPAEDGGPASTALFVTHLLVWVIAIILTGIANLGVATDTFGMGGSSASDVDAQIADPAALPSGKFPDSTKMIGLYSGLCGIFGVLGIILSSALYDKEAYKKSMGTNTVITFLLNYSLVGSFYIFAREGLISDTSPLFTIALFGVLFHLYAVVLFYSCSAALETLALPRAFIPTLAISVQWVNYLEISGNVFDCVGGTGGGTALAHEGGCNSVQKNLAMWIPLLTAIAVGFMIFGRKMLRNASEGGSQIKNAPFIRSIVLTLFLASGILSIYKYAFMAAMVADNVARMFAMFGLLLQFAIIGVVFAPGGKPSANAHQVSPDGEVTAAPEVYEPESVGV